MAGSASALSSWETFYVIVGSSGGALIGLQFVVITLIAESRHRTPAGTLSAFGTPTVVHFAGALLVSAMMSAPWRSLVPLSIVLGLSGVGGLAYGRSWSTVLVDRPTTSRSGKTGFGTRYCRVSATQR